MKNTLLISGDQCCICTSICFKPHHTCDEIYPDDQHKKEKDIKLPTDLTLRKVLSSAFNFPDQTSALTPNYLNLKAVVHTSSHRLQHSQSLVHENNLKGKRKAPRNIHCPMYLEGVKSPWTLHITCWKAEARQLIIITVFNTELPVLQACYFRAFQHAGPRRRLVELAAQAHHVQQQQGCHDPPPCYNHPHKYRLSCCTLANMALQIYPFSFQRLCYS